jgi:hypothetical protein
MNSKESASCTQATYGKMSLHLQQGQRPLAQVIFVFMLSGKIG